MQKLPLISIIVPIYNAESTLKECINSILNQDYPHIEIILINDGSKDNSAQLCENFKARHDNIITIHKTNAGVLSARKEGVSRSHGEWIMFVDADDTIEPQTISIMQRESEDSDIICCNTVYKKNGVIYNYFNNKVQGTSKLDFHKSLLNFQLSGSTWGKLYKRELFKNIKWPDEDIKIGEDFLTTIALIEQCTKIKIKPYYLYTYVQLDNSAMHKKSEQMLNSMLKYIKETEKFYHLKYNDILIKDVNTFILTEYYAYLRYGGKWDKNFVKSHVIEGYNDLPYKITSLYKIFQKNYILGRTYISLSN